MFELPVPFTLFGMVGQNGRMGFSILFILDNKLNSFCYVHSRIEVFIKF